MSNNKFSIKSALTFRCGLLILAIFPQFVLAEVKSNNPYELPPSKLQMETCEREALALHAGEVEQERVFHQQDHFEVRYEIQATDGSEWSVLCDLGTGKIIGEQKLLGDSK